MTRFITLLAALMLVTTAFASAAIAASDESKPASWEAKKFEKLIDHCEARLARADDAAEVGEVRTRCVAEISEFFEENSTVEVSEAVTARFFSLLASLGVPERPAWDIKTTVKV